MPEDVKHDVDVISYDGKMIEVDKKMVPLLKGFWELGIETFFCCEGDPGDDLTSESTRQLAYVMFLRDTYSTDFVEYIFGNYSVFINDTRTLFYVEVTQHPDIDVSRYTIRFPHEDIGMFTEFLKEYAEA